MQFPVCAACELGLHLVLYTEMSRVLPWLASGNNMRTKKKVMCGVMLCIRGVLNLRPDAQRSIVLGLGHETRYMFLPAEGSFC
jgi:hypothetical protein